MVCLSCGFVAPYLDHPGLHALQEMARRQEDEFLAKPNEDLTTGRGMDTIGASGGWRSTLDCSVAKRSRRRS